MAKSFLVLPRLSSKNIQTSTTLLKLRRHDNQMNSSARDFRFQKNKLKQKSRSNEKLQFVVYSERFCSWATPHCLISLQLPLRAAPSSSFTPQLSSCCLQTSPLRRQTKAFFVATDFPFVLSFHCVIISTFHSTRSTPKRSLSRHRFQLSISLCVVEAENLKLKLSPI